MASPNGRKRRSSSTTQRITDEFGKASLDGAFSGEEAESDFQHNDSDRLEPHASANTPANQTYAIGQDAEYRIVTDANGGERYEYAEVDAVYDSDDTDAQEPANTIGDIPLSFYDSYPHIGYDINGKKIMRPATGEALDALLDSIELPKGWTGLTDPQTGKPLNLSQEELELLRKLQINEVPEEGYDLYPVCYLCHSLLHEVLAAYSIYRTWFHISRVSKNKCL